jgi:tripartite-type tricarboxylate transporter receptor subunit TctC
MLRQWVLAALACVGLGAPVSADSVADFYKGKTVTLIVGYSPGGGYDVYARALARHMGKHIPGHPTIVVQNMPGAGSLRAANHLYNAAPKDGTAFGTFARNMPLLALVKSGQNIEFDPRKFTWLGSSSSFADDAYILLTRKDAGVKTIDAARKPGGDPLIIGGTAEGVSSDVMPTVLRDMLGFNIKQILGYTDSAQLFLALERKEIEGRTVGLSAVRSTKPDWLKPDGPMQVLAVFGRATRHPDFPNAPTARELATNPADRALIEALEQPYALSRPYAAPPGVPADRAKALQDAFIATHKDPAYVEDTAKLQIDVSPIGGAEVMRLIEAAANTPPDVMKKIEKYVGEGG